MDVPAGKKVVEDAEFCTLITLNKPEVNKALLPRTKEGGRTRWVGSGGWRWIGSTIITPNNSGLKLRVKGCGAGWVVEGGGRRTKERGWNKTEDERGLEDGL